jgi:ABC-type nitrate/sulfonate/bicarbonate transport system permease component
VAEWANAAGGLGRVIWLANSNLDTATLFAGILTLATIGVALNAVFAVIERKLLRWHAAYQRG